MEITLLRHGQTTANEQGILQGQGESSLTELGREQVRSVASRIDVSSYDLLETSDMDRAQETAALLGTGFVRSSAWRELDIGSWEGKAWPEIREQHAGELDRLRAGEDVRFGGAESLSEFAQRVRRAFEDLATRMRQGQRALVVTHGGVIGEIVKHVTGVPLLSRRFGRSANTALSRLREHDGRWTLTTFNDDSHLSGDSAYLEERLGAGRRLAYLVRHAQTDANVQGRWLGSRDEGLNNTGRTQAEALGARVRAGAVFTSPLGRAVDTARFLDGSGFRVLAGLAEISMGTWEGLTIEEIRARDPESFRRIYVQGEDLPRGGTGETWQGVGLRLSEAVDEALASTSEVRIALISHAAAIRAYLGRVLDLPSVDRYRLGPIENTSVSTLVFEEYGPVLAGFNVI